MNEVISCVEELEENSVLENRCAERDQPKRD